MKSIHFTLLMHRLLLYMLFWEIFGLILYYYQFKHALSMAYKKCTYAKKLMIFLDDYDDLRVLNPQNGHVRYIPKTDFVSVLYNMVDDNPIFFLRNIEYLSTEEYNDIQKILENSHPENLFFVCNKWYSILSYIPCPSLPKRLILFYPPNRDFIFPIFNPLCNKTTLYSIVAFASYYIIRYTFM